MTSLKENLQFCFGHCFFEQENSFYIKNYEMGIREISQLLVENFGFRSSFFPTRIGNNEDCQELCAIFYHLEEKKRLAVFLKAEIDPETEISLDENIDSSLNTNGHINHHLIKPFEAMPLLAYSLEYATLENIILSIYPRFSEAKRDFQTTYSLKNPQLAFEKMRKINRISSLHAEVACIHTFENFFQLEITPKAKALRMLFLELDRIFYHSSLIMESFKGLETEYISRQLRKISLCSRSLSGRYKRFSQSSLVTLGGVSSDIPRQWYIDARSDLRYLEKLIDGVLNSIERNSFLLNHFSRIPSCHKFNNEYPLTGPMLRMQGYNHDVRKDIPYYFYNEVDFEIPLSVERSLFSLLLIRVLEMKESLGIVMQIIDHIPIGSHRHDVEIEISHLKAQECYFSLEAPSGEFGVVLRREEDDFSLTVLSPLLVNLKSLGSMVKGLEEEKLYRYLAMADLFNNEAAV